MTPLRQERPFHNRPFRENLSHRDIAEMSALCISALAPIPIAPFVAATAASERRKSQDLVGQCKKIVGRSSGGALPLFPHRACSTISQILRTKVCIGMRQCACSRRPADFYAELRHYPLVWRWWFSRGVGSNKDATTATASTAPRRARSNREDYAEQKLALAVSNNVGVEIAKIYFASMTYDFGALGGRPHLLRFQRVAGMGKDFRCSSLV